MSQEPCQRYDPQEVLILLLSHGGGEKLDNSLDELSSNLSAGAEVIGPIFHQVTGWARLYMNFYKQNTSAG